MDVAKNGMCANRGQKLSVPPLTPAERGWLQKLENLLKKCPSKRLVLVTGGDPTLTVYDKNHPNSGEFYDFNFEGADLAELAFFEGPNIIGMCK